MSGVSFKDFQLPDWPEVLDACKAIGELIPLMRLQHIDFAFTNQGPKFLRSTTSGEPRSLNCTGTDCLPKECAASSRRMAIEPVTHGSIRFDRKGQLLILDTPIKTFQRQLKAITNAIDWRVRSRFGDAAIDNRIVRAGLRYRQLLGNTTFLGIAGSVGKTTAKDLLVSILNVRGRAIGNPMSLNAAPEIAKVVLRTRPWHRFCVAELGETAPGSLDNQLAVLQPSIGIITVVGDDHLAAFGSRQAIALEFAKLVHSVPAHGTVVLNLDDELVAALSKEAKCRVITYGTVCQC